MEPELRVTLTALLPRLRRFAVALVGASPEADALVRAACEQALRGDLRSLAGARLDGRLYRAMRELRGDPAPQQGTAWPPADPDGSVDGVRRSLSALPAELRAVLLLVCADGFTYQETADALGIPVDRVARHLASARLWLMRGAPEPPPS